MAKFNIKTVKPKFTITTAPDNKIDVVVNKPILTAKNTKTYFKLKNTGGLRGEKGEKGAPGQAATITAGTATSLPAGSTPTVTNTGTSSAAVFNFGIPKGDKGDTGDAGAPGQAATISVGSTTTGAPGTNASVTNTGTSSAAVLNFTIPKGDKGDKGDTGSAGSAATISVGTVTTGAEGSDATVTNSGTSSAAVFDFTIPRGATGATGSKGDKGDQGDAATISVGTTTTGAAGTNASVTNSGTTGAAVLDFTIPRGNKGDKGDKGDTGNPGDAATVTVGTVTTGAPGTSATVVNSGTSSAAVLDFTIPRGDKGESGSGAGDMLAADYDPNGTVQNAGGIVDYVESQIPAENMFYATCTTAAALAAKVATTTSGDFTLTTGNMVRVKFTNAQTYDGTATLNVDSTGAINITRVGTTTITRYWWMAGEVVDFVYDGTNFVMSNKGTATTTYYGLTKLSSSTSSTSTALAATPSAVKAAYDLANSKQDALTAGSNISISNNTISAVDTTYTAGNNISISGTTISATVPTTTSDLTNDGSDGTSTYVEADELATVATSGAYSDLSGAPTVNDATLTIQKNGSSVATFTANSSTATTANITVPTATSDLTNDSGFITDAGVTSFNGSTGAVTYTAPVTSVNGSTGAVTVSVPTATSDLTNDSGFITSADLPTIGNATLTIQKNGTNVQTFTANATSNKTANITVPTATSDLTNDSGFLTSIPTASASTLGGIMVGSGLSVDGSGVLSASSATISSITNATIDTILTK